MLGKPMPGHDEPPPESFCPLFSAVQRRYDSGHAPVTLISALRDRATSDPASGVWTYLVPKDNLIRAVARIEHRRAAGEALPLFGLPFAVKDNIDVEGAPTTAACPAFSYTSARSAPAVQRLLDAGAVLLGKTNLDQFATGLVGTRSPLGVPRNPFDPRYVPGGSSSGSAVAVASGGVAFALGTDTAGSGRVPAAFNNIVGLKPTRGVVSTTGVVPACRSLDCVSVFALSCTDAWRVFEVLRSDDASDPGARARSTIASPIPLPARFRFGLPAPEHLEFFGDQAASAAFADAVAVLCEMGGQPVRIDFAPFRAAARLLYDGPWVAERLVAAGPILRESPEQLDLSVRAILDSAQRITATEVFAGQETLSLLDRRTQSTWQQIDVLVTPTTPTIYTLAQIEADPLRLNTNLGYYTNFANLLDLCAFAVPAGFRADRLPFGITLLAPRGRDAALVLLADRFHRTCNATVGVFPWPSHDVPTPVNSVARHDGLRVAVVGAHLSGEPLNHQLVDLGATLVRSARTAPSYRLFELPGTSPSKPGLLRSADQGVSIELEVWQISAEGLGRLVSQVPAPLCIGSIELDDGERVHGFLCESHAVLHARDISDFGGWRAFRRAGTDPR
jgi:allophanate hydrolase